MTLPDIYSAKAILQWFHDMGADESIASHPTDWTTAPPPPESTPQKPSNISQIKENIPIQAADVAAIMGTPPASPAVNASLASLIDQARQSADSAQTLEQLEAAVRSFEGCALKKMAKNTVFCDGNPQADIMLIGEAPGAEEDAQGIPFCGTSGKLLDAMLASIGLSRQQNVYITNTLFWRPPGNRTPSPDELAICLPFVERHIALFAPKLIILAGGTATKVLLDAKTGITRLRGKPYHYKNQYFYNEVPLRALFHPSYLLRQPAQKSLAWSDLQEIAHIISQLPSLKLN